MNVVEINHLFRQIKPIRELIATWTAHAIWEHQNMDQAVPTQVPGMVQLELVSVLPIPAMARPALQMRDLTSPT
jgi:hypothetical protein